MNMLGFLIQDFFFLLPENKIHTSLRTCVEYFAQIFKNDDSPRKSYEHARFFKDTVNCPKNKMLARMFHKFVLKYTICGGLWRKYGAIFTFS